MEKRISEAWFLNEKNIHTIEPWDPVKHYPTKNMTKSEMFKWAEETMVSHHYDCFLWIEDE